MPKLRLKSTKSVKSAKTAVKTMGNIIKSLSKSGKFPTSLNQDDHDFDALVERIERIKSLSDSGKSIVRELTSIRSRLQKMLSDKNINPQKMDIIVGLLNNMKAISRRLDSENFKKESYKMFKEMQEKDLVRVKTGIEELLKYQRDTIEDLRVSLEKIEEKLKSELAKIKANLENIQKQLAAIEEKIIKLDEEIDVLDKRIKKRGEKILYLTNNVFEIFDTAAQGVGGNKLSQEDRKILVMYVSEYATLMQSGGHNVTDAANQLYSRAENFMVDKMRADGAQEEQLRNYKQNIKEADVHLVMMLGEIDSARLDQEEMARVKKSRDALDVQRSDLSIQATQDMSQFVQTDNMQHRANKVKVTAATIGDFLNSISNLQQVLPPMVKSEQDSEAKTFSLKHEYKS